MVSHACESVVPAALARTTVGAGVPPPPAFTAVSIAVMLASNSVAVSSEPLTSLLVSERVTAGRPYQT
jgi:hypothetical protein